MTLLPSQAADACQHYFIDKLNGCDCARCDGGGGSGYRGCTCSCDIVRVRASVYSCVCNGEGIKGEGGRDGGRGWGEESDVRSAAVRHKLLEEEEELEGWVEVRKG